MNLLKKILVFSMVVLFAGNNMIFCEENSVEMSLKLSNYYLNSGKTQQAKDIIKTELKKNVDDELLWLAYENIIRFDALGVGKKKEGKNDEVILSSPNLMSEDKKIVENNRKLDLPSIKNVEKISKKKKSNEETLKSFFLTKDFAGDFSVILGPTLKMVEGEGITFLKKNNGIVYFSFNLERFPLYAEFVVEHKIDFEKQGSLRFIPLQVRVNDKNLSIRKTGVKSEFSEKKWKCTDFLKRGTNIIEISLPSFSRNYIIKSVSLKRKL